MGCNAIKLYTSVNKRVSSKFLFIFFYRSRVATQFHSRSHQKCKHLSYRSPIIFQSVLQRRRDRGSLTVGSPVLGKSDPSPVKWSWHFHGSPYLNCRPVERNADIYFKFLYETEKYTTLGLYNSL